MITPASLVGLEAAVLKRCKRRLLLRLRIPHDAIAELFAINAHLLVLARQQRRRRTPAE
jgi:hypothetical protein